MRELTTEVEVDGGCDLAHLVLRLDLVETGVGLDDIIELEHHQELVGPDTLYLEVGPVILAELGLAAEPRDLGLGRTHQLTLEYQSVAVVLLSQLRLLREAGREVVGDPHCAGGTPSHLSSLHEEPGPVLVIIYVPGTKRTCSFDWLVGSNGAGQRHHPTRDFLVNFLFTISLPCVTRNIF